MIEDPKIARELQTFFAKSDNLGGYRALPSSRWDSKEDLSLQTFSYSDVFLREFGVPLRPLLFSNRDKIDFEENLLAHFESQSLSEFKELATSLKNTYELTMSARLIDAAPETLNKSTVKIFSDGNLIESVDFNKWQPKEDYLYFLDILYGFVIHNSRSSKKNMEALTPGQYVYAVSSAVTFLMNASELVFGANLLLRSVGVELPESNERNRPRLPRVRIQDRRLGNPRYQLEAALMSGEHFSVPFLEAPIEELEFFEFPGLGTVGPVYAMWTDKNSRKNPTKAVYCRFGRVTDVNGTVRIEQTQRDLGRLTIWNEVTLDNGMLWANTVWGI